MPSTIIIVTTMTIATPKTAPNINATILSSAVVSSVAASSVNRGL